MNMNKLDETACLIAKKDEKTHRTHLIRKLHVDELGTVLIAEEQSVAELSGCLLQQGKLTQN